MPARAVADLIAHLEHARDAGVVTLMHCEDGALLAAAVRRLEAEGRTSLRDYGASRPVVAEVAATQLAASLCESTGAPIYLVHLSCARALAVCRAARAASTLPLFVETRPLYLHLTARRCRGPTRRSSSGNRPLREESDRAALWQGMRDGAIDVLATDHAPWTREQKLDPSLTITRLRPGVSDLQSMLPMYFSEGVVAARPAAVAIRRAHVHQCGAHLRPLSAQGRHPGRRRCRHRDLGSESHRCDTRRGRSLEVRLQRLRGLDGEGLADHDHSPW